ncbi:MAG TPA: PAS domain-containing protein, partial [Opitutaceae bacterium]|nr:PAS domain-containing protein [Opitutaceae bacterium]
AEAARGNLARISGVVAWSAPDRAYLFVADASGGVKVQLPPGSAAPPKVGTGITVLGRVEPGDFAPEIAATDLRPGDNIALPEPNVTSWEEAMTGASYGNWVAMKGYVESVERTGGVTRLTLTTAAGEFSAIVPGELDPNLAGAIAEVTGVCDVITNQRRQLTGIRLLVDGSQDVRVLEAAPSDPFATPVESIGNLLRYNSATSLIRRVHVEGVVLLQRPGELVFVQDGSDTLTLLSRQTTPLQAGDRIAAVGIAGQEGGRLIMRDAVYRRLGHGAVPPPANPGLKPNPTFDTHLVRLRGRLLSREVASDGLRLQLQRGTTIFTARLAGAGRSDLPIEYSSDVQVTGVYRLQLDEYHRPRGISIDLRSPADVVVLHRPAWWTARRVLWVAAVLLTVVVLTISWALTLSRKNRQLRAAERGLKQANEELEERVAARTRDLQAEVEQRRQSEQALAEDRMLLRTLIDNLPVYLYVKDADGRFVIDNLPHARLLGAAACAEVNGKTEADFWPREFAADCARRDRELMERGEALLMHEERFPQGGEACWHSTTKVPLRGADGRVTGLIAIVQDITARREAEAERETLHRQVLETSRQAGMAEVATGVLHNVGNVLNSLNISASLVAESVARSKSERLGLLINLLDQNRENLGKFFAEDPRAQRVPDYLRALSEQLRAEQAHVLDELRNLQRNVEHIKEIVAMQQSYARVVGVTEEVAIQEIIEDALRINQDGLLRHRVAVDRDLRANPVITIERHKVLQILVNLISNAKYACDDGPLENRRLTVSIAADPQRVRITVADNGVGIAADNLVRIFSHGFTTRKNGHGFGLHSGALSAKEMGGSLTVESAGIGRGAAFTLELPVS